MKLWLLWLALNFMKRIGLLAETEVTEKETNDQAESVTSPRRNDQRIQG